MTQGGEHPVPSARRATRRPYQPPRLLVYGTLRRLTAGGSGILAEPNPGTGMQPPNRYP